MSTYPAEWEEQSTVWLSWPLGDAVCKVLPSSKTVLADMAANLIGAVPFVTVLVNGSGDELEVLKMLKERGCDPSGVKFSLVPHAEEWIRDFGPIFLKQKLGLSVASFGWNHWGCLESYLHDGLAIECEEASLISKRCAADLDLPIVESKLVSEGGNREFNGAGVLLATETVELQRNPTLTLAAIEAELKRIFHVQKVYWLKEGVADDDHIFKGPRVSGANPSMLEFNAGVTGGHIDEYCKFLDANTILLAEVQPQERKTALGALTHQRLEENYKILTSNKTTDIHGNPFKVIRIPTPPTMRVTITRDDPLWLWIEQISFQVKGAPTLGKDLLLTHNAVHVVLPASYVNMVICNKTILLPKYGRSKDDHEPAFEFITDEQNEMAIETDKLAKEVLQSFYPDYKIIQIASVPALNLGGGGMHCSSQQQPKI